jgi:anti-anti-sigma factor
MAALTGDIMGLRLEERHCGDVYVIACTGPVVAGEVEVLQSALERGLREFKRLTVNLSGVHRVDSTGMGLLVRFAVRARHGGGDLRLAEPTQFVSNLFGMTKLSTILRIHPTEEEAILGCLHEHFTEVSSDTPCKGRVLFIDNSHDLCVFVRMLLKEHGYEVVSTALVRDARILMRASKIDFLIFGPDCAQAPRESLISSLKQHAPQAAAFHLEPDFKHRAPHEAEATLLGMMSA